MCSLMLLNCVTNCLREGSCVCAVLVILRIAPHLTQPYRNGGKIIVKMMSFHASYFEKAKRQIAM